MTTIIDRVLEQQRAIARLNAEAGRAEGQHRVTAEELKRAESDIEAYHRGVAGGERMEDDDALFNLIATADRIRSRVKITPTKIGRDPIIKDLRVTAAAARLQQQVGDARRELTEFIGRHAADLTEALLARAVGDRDALVAAIDSVEARSQAWNATAALFRELAEPLGLNANEVPRTSPAGDGVQMLRLRLANSHDTPAPVSLVDRDDVITIDARTPQPVGAAH